MWSSRSIKRKTTAIQYSTAAQNKNSLNKFFYCEHVCQNYRLKAQYLVLATVDNHCCFYMKLF